MFFLKETDVNTGYLKLYIASSDQQFKKYFDSNWKRGKMPGVTPGAGQSKKSQTDILLWNFSPANRFSNLEEFDKSHIMTDYAFLKSGVYFIKAFLIIPGQHLEKMEIKPLQIVINEPKGEDLEVWNKIKNEGEVGYFIQHGSVRTDKEKVLQSVEKILQEYADSYLTDGLTQKLEKFHSGEQRRKELIAKAKTKSS